MPPNAGELMESCSDLASRSGCDYTDTYQVLFLTRINSLISGVVTEQDRILHPDAPDDAIPDEKIEMTDEMLTDILARIELMLKEEKMDLNLHNLTQADEVAAHKALCDVLSGDEIEGVSENSEIRMRVLPLAPPGSNIHKVVMAILDGEEFLDAIEAVLREQGVTIRDPERPNGVINFISGFRLIISSHLQSPGVDLN